MNIAGCCISFARFKPVCIYLTNNSLFVQKKNREVEKKNQIKSNARTLDKLISSVLYDTAKSYPGIF